MYNSEQQEQEKQKINHLKEWLLQGNAQFSKTAIQVQAPGRRNVISTKCINKGETIIYIPKHQMISLETIKTNSIIQNILKRKLKLHSPKHCLLAIYLLEQRQDPNSRFKAYIETLPVQCNNFPIFYSEQQLNELRGSPVLEAVERRKFEIQQDYKCITQQDIGFKMDYNDFCWARMIVCSRIFGVLVGDQKTDALVPLADMLNHGVMKQTVWSYSDNKEGFIIQSLENIPKGVQIFDSYGRKSNSRFLLNYGFVIDENESDDIQIKLKFDRKLKNKLLQVCEEDPGKIIFKLGTRFDSGCFDNLLSTIRFILDFDEEEQSFQEPTNNKTTFSQPTNSFSSCESELRCWNYLHSLFMQMLDQYPTTMSEDVELMQQSQNILSFNKLNCLKLRLAEKKIINYYIQICQTMQHLFSLSPKGFLAHCRKRSYKEYKDYLLKINSAINFPKS